MLKFRLYGALLTVATLATVIYTIGAPDWSGG